ncbi:F0F1 ATP synthase subunit B [Konateibacter massiliensis]|uniref:F0F1 ATP synthase subunit B n=1 Tax=Konateibacter massiliensis TaxID=2002841 RepID=UPI000C151D2F|nr:F0F1 ATP synthase subunit B [Konateibacter massiliensis]
MERLFNLDVQLLADLALVSVNVFLLFLFLSYMLFNPVRNLLEARKSRIKKDQDTAIREKEDAALLKEEYDKKLREINREAELILNDAHKQALRNEDRIINEARLEAQRIVESAKREAELEKKRATDELKQEVIAIASLMASKVIADRIDVTMQEALVDEAIEEMGYDTWISL